MSILLEAAPTIQLDMGRMYPGKRWCFDHAHSREIKDGLRYAAIVVEGVYGFDLTGFVIGRKLRHALANVDAANEYLGLSKNDVNHIIVTSYRGKIK